ncbi:gamma-glutamyltransferase [Winogradskyella sp. PC-19]|uniref:gamma-glutamyltransferase n=1 Tax=unclassified Winogradskyella TaxID=2615021 RepID=UPI000B3D4092|nr:MULTISPECIES: gamma-glutamyltransferase [unclassified Winogradskyella]ARV08677.1 gamma-glutamyltransferase [Winogradskyella sp. PC-19]RZN79242.1 MAG: gamma-glutamyltransferase [Winogradskyella sp.]
MKNALYLLLIISLVFGCKENQKTTKKTENKRGLVTDKAMVVSAREEASKIGSQILELGGNAFDAMMATEMALAVSYPYAGNLGGGGFLIYRLADGEVGALDYREKAPIAAKKDMYLDEKGDVIKGKSTIGPLAIGIPGTIAGVFKAQERFGKLDVATVLKPVFELAENGFVITKNQERRFKNYDSLFYAVNGKKILFNKKIKAGQKISNNALASTLKRIAQNGRDEFYKGETAKILVEFLQERGSIITLEDLAKYEAKWREPIQFQYDDLTITSMSPPSSGGICLNQIMTMVEDFDLSDYGHNSLKTIQVLVEAEKRAYADRSYYLGDPDFVDIPVETLTSSVYLQDRMNNFSFETATAVDSISHGKIVGYESEETTHYSIVDQFGNAIAVTTTLNGGYGSKVYADELGFFLNNEMDDFSSKPGEPNYYGLIGAEANSIVPEKRMLSSMTPTIVEKDGELLMSVGTPGGSTIITSVLQTILNVHEFKMTMQEAVNAPRFHNQWLPDEIRMEPSSFDRGLIKQLEAKGYIINETRSPIIGIVDGILILDNGKLEGGADKRGDDTAFGF